MNRVTIPADILADAIKMNIEGATLKQIGKKIGFNRNIISREMFNAGHNVITHYIAHNAKDFPKKESIERYLAGESIKALADEYGIQRKTLTDYFIRNNVKTRNRSQAAFYRMERTTPEERMRLTEAAHNAVRGIPHTREQRQKMMVTRKNRRVEKFVGFGEDAIKDRLVNAGFCVVPQEVFDIYNIDLMVNGNIAVEILIGSGYTKISKGKGLEKNKKLIESGYFPFWILWTDGESLMHNIDNIISDIDLISRNPSALGKYRVVMCRAERFTRFHNERGQFSVKPSPVKFFYEDRTEYVCIP